MRELSVFSAADEAPNRECLIDGDHVYSFAQVATKVAAAIERLKELGVESGSMVAFSPRADLGSVIWLFALFELGAPALLLHPRFTLRERKQLLARAPTHHWLDEKSPAASVPCPVERFDRPSDDPLALVYTSGTSATPRGAVLSRRAFLASAHAHADHLGWCDDDRWLLAMPPAHIGGLSILTRSLVARRCVVLAPGGFDPETLEQRMTQPPTLRQGPQRHRRTRPRTRTRAILRPRGGKRSRRQ